MSGNGESHPRTGSFAPRGRVRSIVYGFLWHSSVCLRKAATPSAHVEDSAVGSTEIRCSPEVEVISAKNGVIMVTMAIVARVGRKKLAHLLRWLNDVVEEEISSCSTQGVTKFHDSDSAE